jgi:hypothetical protein
MKTWTKRFARWALAIVFAVAFVRYLVLPLMSFKTALAYPWLRRQWNPQQEIQHFPKERPKGATTAGFYFDWGHYQATTVMEWRLKYLPVQFSNELQRLSEIWTTAEDRRYAASYEKTSYRTFSNNPGALVAKILHAKPTVYAGVDSWNHGNVYGYSVDQKGREIVYWIERW